jgi:hypothetical protein
MPYSALTMSEVRVVDVDFTQQHQLVDRLASEWRISRELAVASVLEQVVRPRETTASQVRLAKVLNPVSGQALPV